MPTFIFNDENKTNSYGFRVKTAGISLERFQEYPVCLNDHKNETNAVLGKWTNIQSSEAILSGTPEFDTEDKEGKEVVRKVQKGIIKGCSMGLLFDPEELKVIDGEIVLTKCELKEVSIVAIPSNANSISLYNKEGVQLTDKEVKQICLKAQNYQFKNHNMELEEIIQHLQLKADANTTDILTAVKSLEAKLTASKNKNEELEATITDLKDKAQARLKAEFDSELETAVKDGRLDEAGKPAVVELSEKSYESALNLLKALPKRKKIADSIETEEALLADFDKMSWKELDKGNHLESLKLKHNDYYVERFKKQFGVEPKS